MDKKIQLFLQEQKNLTICTSVDDNPYCASCFYAYCPEDDLLIFKSGRETKHILNALINNKVAGTVIPDIHKIATIRGIQFTGRFYAPKGELLERVKSIYYKRHPLALATPGELWVTELVSLKMIDNTLGFGKKLVWEKTILKTELEK
jgi:uncharacterized protein